MVVDGVGGLGQGLLVSRVHLLVPLLSVIDFQPFLQLNLVNGLVRAEHGLGGQLVPDGLHLLPHALSRLVGLFGHDDVVHAQSETFGSEEVGEQFREGTQQFARIFAAVKFEKRMNETVSRGSELLLVQNT